MPGDKDHNEYWDQPKTTAHTETHDPAFVVKDRSFRQPDHPAHSAEQACALVQHFTEHDPDSRCYVVPSKTTATPDDLLADVEQALDDWVVTYASDNCTPTQVHAAWTRITANGGTLSYVTDLRERVKECRRAR